jgi:hypothetical protein
MKHNKKNKLKVYLFFLVFVPNVPKAFTND